MKKIKFILFSALFAMSATSCRDAIDIVQEGEISDAAIFSSSKNLEGYLNGAVYGSLDNSAQIKFNSVFTDELRIGPSSVGGDLDLYRYIITPNNGYAASIWSSNYTTIQRVNTLIEGATKFTPGSADMSQYNNTLGEARAIRALAYLNLLAYFSPNMKDPSALGVMLSTKPALVGDILPRVNNGQIFSVMESDLDFAYNNINTAYQTTASRKNSFFVSKAAVNAIRARMYLYRGVYAMAAQYAQAAITDSGLVLTPAIPVPTGVVGSSAWNTQFYALAGGPSPYRRLWVDAVFGGATANTDENIFKLSRPSVGSGGIAGLYTTNSTNMAGAPQWTVGLNLFSAMNSLANDVRRYAFIDPTSANNNYVIDKYPGKGTTPLKNDIKMFRISEMILILAESAAQNNLTQAAEYIRQIREARIYTGTAVAPVYTSKADALKDILKERRVEFAFEGHRYLDLKRIGAEAGVGIDRNAADDWLGNTTITPPSTTDYRFTLPIPSSEITANPGIAQNPQY